MEFHCREKTIQNRQSTKQRAQTGSTYPTHFGSYFRGALKRPHPEMFTVGILKTPRLSPALEDAFRAGQF